MKKTTLALILSSILANVAVAETAPTYVDITINNIKEDTGIELGTNSRARGDGSIATGKNSVAIGKNAVATGGNETKDTINQKLNENKQRLQEIQTAQDNTERLLKELQNIRKVEADVIEAGERVKQVRLAKQSAYNVWQDKLKTYNDTVAGSAQFLKDAQAKIDDLNSRLTGVSRIGGVDISSEEGLTHAATQLKSIAEEDTTLNLSVDFYKDYVSSYYQALGDIRQKEITYESFNRYSLVKRNSFSSSCSIYRCIDAKDYINEQNKDKIKNKDINPFLNYVDFDTSIISQQEWDEAQKAAPVLKELMVTYYADINEPFVTEEILKAAVNYDHSVVDIYLKRNEIAYYQGQYEATKNTSWLDKKAKALNEFTHLEEQHKLMPNPLDLKEQLIDQWYAENIKALKERNIITTTTLTSELEKALGINKHATEEKQAQLARLKTEVEQAKSAYDNTNPSQADIALSQRYEQIMGQLTAKANELKSEQERLQALRHALTLHDLTNVGENAMAIGTDALSTGTNSMAIGTNTIATGENAIAIGKDSAVTGTNSIAIGTGHIVIGNNAGTFGDPNTIYGDNSYAIGNNNTIGSSATPHTVGTNTFVLGNNVTTTANNAVILGAGSVGKDNTVSVGKPGAERQIINVAAGTLSSTSTDAVNGSQLQGVKDDLLTEINKKGAAVKVINGTNTTVTEGTEGNLTTYAVNVSSDAIKEAVQNDLNGKADVDAGNITGSNIGKWQEKLGNGTNTKGDKGLITGDTFNTELNKKADKSDITNINTDLAKKANIDASNINVAKFAEKLGTGIVEAGNASLVTGGTVATALENKADSNLSNITNTAKTVIKNLAKDSVKVVKGTNTTVTTSTDGETTTYAVNVSEQSIKNVMQSDMNTKANTDASNIDITKFAEKLGTGTVSKNDTNLVSGKTVYLALQNAVLNGVDVANKANKDASNLSEEDKIAWQESLGNGKAEAGNKGLVTGDTLNSVLDAKVTQVNKTLDSKSNTDASNIDVAKYTIKLTTGRIELGNKGLVNGGQVHNYVQSQVAEMGGRTLAEANSYTDYRIGSLKEYTDKRLREIRDEARAGVASAMAMSAIPAVPNKRFSIGAGTAAYHGQNAVAVGLKVKTENDKAIISLTGSASSNGDFGAAAGFAFGF